MRHYYLLIMGLFLTYTINAQSPIYFENFENGIDDCTIYGCGEIVQDDNSDFNHVFETPQTCTMEKSFLDLPKDIYNDLKNYYTDNNCAKQVTCGVWVKIKDDSELKNSSIILFSIYKNDASNPYISLTSDFILNINYNNKSKEIDFGEASKYLAYIKDGCWHYYTATFTTTNASIYLDGKLVKLITLPDEFRECVLDIINNGNANVAVGLTATAEPTLWIDEVAIYPVALSESEILALVKKKDTSTNIDETDASTEDDIISVEYYDIKGNLMGDDYSDLSRGIYIKKIEYSSGSSKCVKIVKTNY